MKKSSKNFQLASLLSLALFGFGLNFAAVSSTAAPQDTKRERVVASPTPTPKKTPKNGSSPKQAPTPTPQPTTTPTPVPTPVATPTPTPTPIPVQTLTDLQSRIRTSLARPELRRGQVGLKIISLETGKVLFDENSEKYFMPASNMKNFTIATALARLSPNFRFVTSVYANSMPDSSGVIHGDLTVYGRGDPSFSAAFNDGDSSKVMDALVQKIVQSGVKRIEGNLIGDESYFNTEPIPSTWEWDDLQWYYGAGVSALTVNDNSLDIKITPNSQLGMPAIVTLTPANSLFTIVNLTSTLSAGEKRSLEITKRLDSNVLEIRGSMPADDKGYTGAIAVSKPAELFVALLKNALQQKGVMITGQTRTMNYKAMMDASRPPTARSAPAVLTDKNSPANSGGRVEITRLESVPFSVIAARTMKPSQNLYTELILRALGEQLGDKTDPKKTSEARGLEIIQKFTLEAGIEAGSILQYDGCGLSRHDLITPAAAARLYEYMNSHQYAQAWRDALTIGGVDGTLQNRFRGTAAANNVRGKTGTIDQVSALSGYVTTAGGEKLAFSIITNGIPQGRLRTETIDEIVVALANFNGKTNPAQLPAAAAVIGIGGNR